MDYWTWSLLIIACSFIYYCFKRSLNYFADLDIPYIPEWPLLGAFDFTRPMIMLRDPELIKSVTIKHFDHFPDHRSFIDVTLDPLFGGNLLNMGGEKWKESRNLLSPAFTSSKMKMMFELIVDCLKNFVNYIDERPQEENEMVDTKDLFTRLTNDAIATCAFGISVDSLRNPTNEFYTLGREATNLDSILSLKFFVSRAFPPVMKIFNIKFVSDRVGNFFKNIVSTTVKTRDDKGITRPDMLQLMMDARGKGSKNLKLDITEMTAQAFIFFFGGFDPTSTHMCLMAHEIAINSDIQKKLQTEIDGVMRETGNKPTYEDIKAMPYLNAVFNETSRRHAQVAFLDRMCKTPFDLPPAPPGGKPFTVPPGMTVWIPSVGIHMDPKYYENPEKFDPERYYQKKVTINDVTNLGFGIGPRSCIGNRFASLEAKILFFYLLSKFSLKPNAKTCSPLKYGSNSFTLMPKGGFSLTIQHRS